MILFNKAFAKLWHIDVNERYTDVRFSTSEKDRQNEGEYINSNWLGRMVGKAHEKAEDLDGKERIIITSGKISNVYNAEKEKSYVNVIIFDFELQDEDEEKPKKSSSKKSSKSKSSTSKGSGKSKIDRTPVTDDDDDEEDWPFA